MQVTGSRPRIVAAADGRGVVGHAGARLLADLADATGLTGAFSEALAPLRVRRSGHDPGRIAVDVAVMLADGGEANADLAVLGHQTDLFGAVAPDPTPPPTTPPSSTKPSRRSRTRTATAPRSSSGPTRPAAPRGSWPISVACASTASTPTSPLAWRSPNRSARPSATPPTGSRPSTPTATCATAPKSARSPGWSRQTAIRPAPGSSCAANARTPARS